MARVMCKGTGEIALLHEESLPDGTKVIFGSCMECGWTPEELVLGQRPKVRGFWLIPYHEVNEEEQ